MNLFQWLLGDVLAPVTGTMGRLMRWGSTGWARLAARRGRRADPEFAARLATRLAAQRARDGTAQALLPRFDPP